MYGKKQANPCPMCTMWIDGFNGVARHLAQNVAFVIAAAGDLAALRQHARNRGWHNIRLLGCGTSTFKYDLLSEDAEGNQSRPSRSSHGTATVRSATSTPRIRGWPRRSSSEESIC
jgi:predicted dithiol-disulfide oxidoreductase (DUF899 family)